MKRKILPAALSVLLQTGCSHEEMPDETTAVSAETAAVLSGKIPFTTGSP